MGCNPKITEFESREAMAAQLADDIAMRLARAIELRGEATAALSGGSTPAGLYEALSERELDWARVTVTLVDERWVAPGAEGSNESFVRSCLMRNRAAAAKFIGLWSDAPTAAEGLAKAEARYKNLAAPFDVVVLGIGSDGHTASWFPHAEGLECALAPAGPQLAAVTVKKSVVTGSHPDRMTLSLAGVCEADFICLLMTGEEKRSVFECATQEGAIEDMPVRAVMRGRPDMLACWAP